jgi:hypothetical protein
VTFLHRLAYSLGLSLSIALCLQTSLFGQVFELRGGTSTLYQAGGGSITMHAPSYDLTVGAGTIDGHIYEGAQLIKATPHAKYILGDDRISFHLPTDIFDSSHFLFARGIGMSTTRAKTDILVFAGATATDYNSPLFDAAKTDDPAGILFLTKKLNPRWQLFSDTIISKRQTHIEAVQWSPLPKLDLALAVGVGANQPYAAASVNLSRTWIDAQVAYISAGQQFHRVDLVSPLFAEPDRENVLVTVRPLNFITLSGAHQNYLVPQFPSTTNVRSSVDQGSAGIRVLGTLLNGSIYHSTYLTESNHAVSLSATREFTDRFRVMGNYLASRPKNSAPTNSFISTFTEKLTSRLSLTENLTTSGGHTGITFGGQFLSNLMTISADYQTVYVPAQNSSPFEQALVLDVKLNLFGRLNMHGATFVDATGQLRHTVDASTIMSRGQTASAASQYASVGDDVMRGCFVDSSGHEIEGAALLIDKKVVYTDSTGCFLVREHKPRTHTFQVVPAEFLASGNWSVVSAPSSITSGQEQDKGDMPIIVVMHHTKIEVSTMGASVGAATLK